MSNLDKTKKNKLLNQIKIYMLFSFTIVEKNVISLSYLQGQPNLERDGIRVASSMGKTWACHGLCFTYKFSSRSKAVNFSQSVRGSENKSKGARCLQCQCTMTLNIYFLIKPAFSEEILPISLNAQSFNKNLVPSFSAQNRCLG